jgi:hypothetical protein
LASPTYLISSLQLDSFRSGSSITQEEDIKKRKRNLFVSENITLKSCEKMGFVANVNQIHQM